MTDNGNAGDKGSGISEEIQRHAPRPVLRPGGRLRIMADEVDRAVYAEQKLAKDLQSDAVTGEKSATIENKWSARLSASRKRGLGYRLSRDGS